MINFFQFAPNEKSLQYLANIFGYMNGIIPYHIGGGTTPSGASISLLGTMFKTFNSVVLAIGALIVIYMTVVGVIATAHEGEFMGKKWNNIWIPIRTVLGIAALVPTGSGYSGIQLIMMWVIVQGIGAADVLWSTTLSYVNLVGSPFAKVTIPSVNVNQAMTGLFQGLVCDASAHVRQSAPQGLVGNYFCSGKTDGFCRSNIGGSGFTFNTQFVTAAGPNNNYPTKYSLGPNGTCGELTFCNQAICNKPNPSKTEQLQCVACKGQIQALEAIIPVLSNIAVTFVTQDYNYRDFAVNSYNTADNPNWKMLYDYCDKKQIPRDKCCINSTDLSAFSCKATSGDMGSFPPINRNKLFQNVSDEAVNDVYWPYSISPTFGETNFIDTLVNQYMNTVTTAVTDYIQTQAQDPSVLKGRLAEAQSTGWIFAGAYYYTIAKMNDNNLANSIPALSISTVNPSQNPMKGYRNNFDAANSLIAAMNSSNGGMLSSTPQLSGFTGPLSATMGSSTAAFQSALNGDPDGDVISQIQTAGRVMLIIVQVAYTAFLVVTIVLGLYGNFTVFALGTGATNPLGPTATMLYFLFVPALFAFIGLLITMGGLLGIYVPLIPYIIFTFGAVNWLLSTVETMVAGPLVALGILSPSGQHELMGKSEPALMLLLSVFLRPSLMIFGLMASMLVASVVVRMINYAFWTTVAQSLMVYDPLSFAIFLCAYVTLIVTSLNKAFALIHLLPDRVMQWIGVHHVAGAYGGEAEAASEAKGAVSSASAGGKGAIVGGTQKAGAEAGSKDRLDREKNPTAKKGP